MAGHGAPTTMSLRSFPLIVISTNNDTEGSTSAFLPRGRSFVANSDQEHCQTQGRRPSPQLRAGLWSTYVVYPQYSASRACQLHIIETIKVRVCM